MGFSGDNVFYFIFTLIYLLLLLLPSTKSKEKAVNWSFSGNSLGVPFTQDDINKKPSFSIKFIFINDKGNINTLIRL